jgi:hypothetical protein
MTRSIVDVNFLFKCDGNPSYILENYVPSLEYLKAKRCMQSLVFPKLDSSKAFDKLLCNFLFGVLAQFGMVDKFISTVHMFCEGVDVAIHVNGHPSSSFKLRQGIH